MYEDITFYNLRFNLNVMVVVVVLLRSVVSSYFLVKLIIIKM